MTKANQKAEAVQVLDNLALNPINRVGDPGVGSRNTGHSKELPTNQSSLEYDKKARGINNV